MKKLIIILTVAVAIIAMSVSALAAPGGFIESPSANGAPTIVGGNSDGGVRVIAYRDRKNSLSAEQIANFESAYKSVVDVSNISDVNSELSDIASAVKVNAADLAVSDLFYVDIDGEMTSALISLESATFSNFVCLLRYDGSNWVVVDTKIEGDDIIAFDALPGEYAVVVSTGATPDRNTAGCRGCRFCPICLIIILIILTAIIVTICIIRREKKDKKEDKKAAGKEEGQDNNTTTKDEEQA